ncbi:MAG: FtsW/RodA/SpoVE family cell cycle protein [Alphaproteobacteria bacterium]|nr:FtsW/RodA/SpoVE family cell cycle protein [Alphaproteobacteria bacterium]
MIRITRGEESRLTSWFFEIDRGLLGAILCLVAVSIYAMISAGSAQAARMNPPQPWFYFLIKALPAYFVGVVALFATSMLNTKQIIRVSIIILILGAVGLLTTVAHPVIMKGSARWAHFGSFSFMPADILKPAFIMLTAWFLSKMHEKFGEDIIANKEAWKAKILSWWPYLIIFAVFAGIILLHPDLGTFLLYCGVLFAMLFVAGLPLKYIPLIGLAGAGVGAFALLTMSHIQERAKHIFHVEPYSQAWYSINSIKHGGLLGSGDEAFVKDTLPESTNDFVFSAIAEDCGAIVACALVLFLLYILLDLIKKAVHARDHFVVYAITGTAALFGLQICFNLATALHLFIDKGMTLPFISYGGVSFVSFCVLFGMLLAVMREEEWSR